MSEKEFLVTALVGTWGGIIIWCVLKVMFG
jgi:hypothetical protein